MSMSTRRVAGALAAAASAALLVTVLVRDVGLNVLNGWTIALGILAAGLLLSRRAPGTDVLAVGALVVAMVPALIGGLGLLYLPSLVLATNAAMRDRAVGSG